MKKIIALFIVAAAIVYVRFQGNTGMPYLSPIALMAAVSAGCVLFYNFLPLELDNKTDRELYARITALTLEELPTETIEGRITGGSINLDGNSALRRTCNLTMVANEVNINDYYWGLHSKVKIEVGIKNTIDEDRPDIIWFPQGIFVLTTFNTSHTTNNY